MALLRMTLDYYLANFQQWQSNTGNLYDVNNAFATILNGRCCHALQVEVEHNSSPWTLNTVRLQFSWWQARHQQRTLTSSDITVEIGTDAISF